MILGCTQILPSCCHTRGNTKARGEINKMVEKKIIIALVFMGIVALAFDFEGGKYGPQNAFGNDGYSIISFVSASNSEDNINGRATGLTELRRDDTGQTNNHLISESMQLISKLPGKFKNQRLGRKLGGIAPSRSPTKSKPTKSPAHSKPTKSPLTSKPTFSPTYSRPSASPSFPTFSPTKSPTVSHPTKSPRTSRPSKSPVTPRPTTSPTYKACQLLTSQTKCENSASKACSWITSTVCITLPCKTFTYGCRPTIEPFCTYTQGSLALKEAQCEGSHICAWSRTTSSCYINWRPNFTPRPSTPHPTTASPTKKPTTAHPTLRPTNKPTTRRPTPPTTRSPTPKYSEICYDGCPFAKDGECDDVNLNPFGLCYPGSDCTDCKNVGRL